MIAELRQRRDYQEHLTDAEWAPSGPATAPNQEALLMTGEHDQPAWIWPTAEALRELLELPANWNSYGARPVELYLVEAAFTILSEAAREKDLPVPNVVPTAKGSVQFEWHTRGIDLEMGVKRAGLYHVFFEDAQHNQTWEGDFSSNLEPLAKALDELERHA